MSNLLLLLILISSLLSIHGATDKQAKSEKGTRTSTGNRECSQPLQESSYTTSDEPVAKDTKWDKCRDICQATQRCLAWSFNADSLECYTIKSQALFDQGPARDIQSGTTGSCSDKAGLDCTVEHGPWNICSKMCDGGFQMRENICKSAGIVVDCNECKLTPTGPIFEFDDQPCNTYACPVCQKEMDVALLLDSSGSITRWYVSCNTITITIDQYCFPWFDFRRDVVADAAGDFVEVVYDQDVSIKVAIVLFADDAQIFRRFNQPVTADEVRKLPRITGGTKTGLGMDKLKSDIFTTANGDRPTAKNVAIVFTDGESNEPAATVVAAKALRGSNVEIYSVGVAGAKLSELNDIASSNTHVYFTHQIEALKKALYKTLKAMCPDAP
ncbi:unnamed protein product [Didymodactylos carnosus]|uniref:VWFA domain-containing protein n=1 Tax=Didymodactylos carnosus TaxID=1234261 RepID=A0A814IY14_9BILA|nr:unnamed protein product [Didymodactylos carnosus]CAF3801436.1 unnamed protein product [Didymodactylos carnosus]